MTGQLFGDMIMIHHIVGGYGLFPDLRRWYNEEESHLAKKIVLAGACRTAIGTMGGASLSTVPAADLGAVVIREALKRAGVAPDQVDQVYMGCVIQAGQGQNIAAGRSINAGLPIEVTAVTINVVCGSGLQSVNMAAQMIEAGDADIVVAGRLREHVPGSLCDNRRAATATAWAMPSWWIRW